MGKRGRFLCRYVSGPSSRFPSLSRRGTMGIEVVQVVSHMESQGNYGDYGVQVVSLMELQGDYGDFGR